MVVDAFREAGPGAGRADAFFAEEAEAFGAAEGAFPDTVVLFPDAVVPFPDATDPGAAGDRPLPP